MISRLVLNLRSVDSVEIEGDHDFSPTNPSNLSAWNAQVTTRRRASNGQPMTINTTMKMNETLSTDERDGSDGSGE